MDALVGTLGDTLIGALPRNQSITVLQFIRSRKGDHAQ